MIRRFDAARRAVLLAVLALAASGPALAQEGPDALVKRVSEEVMQVIKSDPKVQAGDTARIREVVETKLLPNFDFPRMTALAMGRNWTSACPTSTRRFIPPESERMFTSAFDVRSRWCRISSIQASLCCRPKYPDWMRRLSRTVKNGSNTSSCGTTPSARRAAR